MTNVNKDLHISRTILPKLTPQNHWLIRKGTSQNKAQATLIRIIQTKSVPELLNVFDFGRKQTHAFHLKARVLESFDIFWKENTQENTGSEAGKLAWKAVTGKLLFKRSCRRDACSSCKMLL